MGIGLNGIIVENFKSYNEMQKIELSDLSVFMGANSSGKSTALQTLLAIKQTMECNSPEIDLLLSGKYVTLGDFDDVVNDVSKNNLRMGISITGGKQREDYGEKDQNVIIWAFSKDRSGHIKLIQMDFDMEGAKVELKLEDNNSYRIFVNRSNTQMSVELCNLKVNRYVINYDREFNKLFQKFVNGLLRIICGDKKFSGVEKTKMVSKSGIQELYYNLMGDIRNTDFSGDSVTIDVERADEVRDKVLDLLDRYCEHQFRYFESYAPFSKDLRRSLWGLGILQGNRVDEIEVLCEKYEEELAAYEKADSQTKHNMQRETLPRNVVSRVHNSEKGQESELDIISEAFMDYRECIGDIFDRIFYLGPIREKPQGLYNVGFETIPKYVGPTGEFFASVLLHENKRKEYILPNNICETMDLLEALDEWAVHLNIASEVKVEQSNSFGFSVSIANTQQKKSDIMNVGIGTSQVLPVLITGLLSEEGEVLIFEQPELHLHPFSQSRLADFFVALVKQGRKIIVETHSEYLILRLRYHILTESIDEKQLVINFFQNKIGTQVYKGILSGYGNLQYPSDFCDETQELINDLMNASLMKKRNEDGEKRID